MRRVALEELRAEALAVAAGVTAPRPGPARLLEKIAIVGSLGERAVALRALGEAAALGGDGFAGALSGAAREALEETELRAPALAALGALRDRHLAPLFARALGDRSDDVRDAAAGALLALAREALPVLLVSARVGSRFLRQSALEILRKIESLPAACDDLIDAEVADLAATTQRRAALAGAPLAERPAGRLLVARLDERAGEIARTLVLAVELRVGDRRVGEAARRLSDRRARGRALEALDALLPRSLGRRVLPALEGAAGDDPPSLDDALRAELGGDDGLARLLLVHALEAPERAALRDAILAAARDSAGKLDPLRVLRRVGQDDGDDVPRSVETMLALQRLPLFSELTPSQIAELAGAAAWATLDAGESVEVEGLIVADGLAHGTPALFGPETATYTATKKLRILKLLREDFARIIEDTPEVAIAICRVLARQQNCD